MTRRLATALLLSFAAAACGPTAAAPAPTPTAAGSNGTVVEETAGGAKPTSHEPASRFPKGSAVVRVNGTQRTPLSPGLAAAGAPSVAFDASRVLFIGRETDDAPFAVFSCAPDGSDRRVAAKTPRDCGGAATLPDGRIVYSAATDEPVRVGPPDALRGWALFVGAGDGTEGSRITWGGLDVDPCVLSDGRILFSTWRPREDGGRFVLATVHPDGTGVAPFRVDAASALRASQRPSLDVDFLRATDTAAPAACSWDVPSHEIPAVAALSWSLDPRPRPQGHLSSVRADAAFATLLSVDARVGGRGTKVRVLTGDRLVGESPLASDGSFFVRVPANRPLHLEVIDAAGAAVGRERGSFWLRPGETRVCVRCHDDAETGPPNVRAAALAGDPVDLASDGGNR